MTNEQPRLIVINQTISTFFTDWLTALADEHGPIELWSGNATSFSPSVKIRSAARYDKSSNRSRLWTWLHFTLVVSWWLIWHNDKTPIFVVTNPPFMPLIAYLLYRLQGRPYVLLEWDIYPNVLDVMGIVTQESLIYKLWHGWHARALANARLVITIGDYMADKLRVLAANPQLEVTVIPNWIDTNWIQPVAPENNPFLKQHDLQDKFIVLYSGNLGETHSIETIIDTAKLLVGDEDIVFLFIGEGSKRAAVEKAIHAGCKNIRLLAWQPVAQLPFSLASAHIGIITLSQGYEGLSMPSKTYAMLAAGAAILSISAPPNDLALTIEQSQCGSNFLPNASNEIAGWIRKVFHSQDQLARYRELARDASIQYYDSKVCIQRMNEVTMQVCTS